MTCDPVILMFVKAPLPGTVKSRLAAALGEETALELYRNFALDMLSAVDRTGFASIVFFHPPDAASEVARWLGRERSYRVQEGADVGERMEQAFRAAFSLGHSRAILIGSDIPDLPPGILRDALDALADHDAAIGPAEDGGYYLIGFRDGSFLPEVFRSMPWSTDQVFARTMDVLERAGKRVRSLPRWRDVDTVPDLRGLAERNADTDFRRSRTMNYLGRIRKRIRATEGTHAGI